MQAQTTQYATQRRHPRYTCQVGVEIRTADSANGYWGTLADICQGGCYINSFSPLPVSTEVVLVIRSDDGPAINIKGRTVTSHPGLGMGIEFSGFMRPEDEAQLKTMLGSLAQGS